jgi:hypothetical protein
VIHTRLAARHFLQGPGAAQVQPVSQIALSFISFPSVKHPSRLHVVYLIILQRPYSNTATIIRHSLLWRWLNHTKRVMHQNCQLPNIWNLINNSLTDWIGSHVKVIARSLEEFRLSQLSHTTSVSYLSILPGLPAHETTLTNENDIRTTVGSSWHLR